MTTTVGRVQDKVAIITGAASGPGLASDESCAVNGAEMVVDNTSSLTVGVVPRH